MIDLPGGGREASETPIQTLLREVKEEVGLHLTADRITGGTASRNAHGKTVWFFVCPITVAEGQGLVLGDEGQSCWMMPIEEFLAADDAIALLQDCVRAVFS